MDKWKRESNMKNILIYQSGIPLAFGESERNRKVESVETESEYENCTTPLLLT